MTRLTTGQVRLVEEYVSVLDYLSRCALAVERDDWFYLYDKSAELVVQADRVAGGGGATSGCSPSTRGVSWRCGPDGCLRGLPSCGGRSTPSGVCPPGVPLL